MSNENISESNKDRRNISFRYQTSESLNLNVLDLGISIIYAPRIKQKMLMNLLMLEKNLSSV